MSQSRHLGANPLFSSSSNKYSHDTESKAFDMSSLNISADFFVRWQALAKFLTYRKLSCMQRFFMKALCDTETILSISFDKRRASTFDTNLAKEWMRLIGQKSPGNSAVSFFGIRVIDALFSFGSGPTLRLWKAWTAAETSTFMIYQQDL